MWAITVSNLHIKKEVRVQYLHIKIGLIHLEMSNYYMMTHFPTIGRK